MANIKIRAKGMHCKSCEMLIKESLEEINGVSRAEASQKSGIVTVEFDSSKVTRERIVEAIASGGYKVE